MENSTSSQLPIALGIAAVAGLLLWALVNPQVAANPVAGAVVVVQALLPEGVAGKGIELAAAGAGGLGAAGAVPDV